MTRRDLWPLLSLGALALSGCNSAPRTIRYRLTLDVDTPDGLKTGSGVIQITMNYNDGLLRGLGNPANPSVKGEAVVVDLGSAGILFCLLKNPSYFLPAALPKGAPIKEGSNYYDSLRQYKPNGDVAFDRLPMLVRFHGIDDPPTVAQVDPNDLATTFGAGVKLVRATIAITDDPVTTGITKYLGWWFAQAKPGYDPPAFRYRNNSPRGYGTISILDFVEGISWRPLK